MNRARVLGICNDKLATVIDFPGDAILATFFVENVDDPVNETPETAAEINKEPAPEIRKVIKDLLRCVVDWFNG